MNLRISLGGDIIQYLGTVGLLKALQEFEGSESNESNKKFFRNSLLWLFLHSYRTLAV